MQNQERTLVGILLMSAVAGLGATMACQRDDWETIYIDLCPSECTGCMEDDEKYTCHLVVLSPAGNPLQGLNGSWTGEACAPKNSHPTEIGLSYALPCAEQCNTAVVSTLGPGHSCAFPYETSVDDEGHGVLEWKVFRDGPICDSALNGTGGGGADTGGVCEGDSGTGAYDDKPADAVCPPWYQPGPLVASTPRQTGVLDVNIATSFVENIKKDNFATLVCDSGRYIEGKFRHVERGDLFYEIGFRNNDSNLRVRGHNNGTPTTGWFDLDVPNQISSALIALHSATGLHFRVNRTGMPNNTYDIWLKVIPCSGACPPP